MILQHGWITFETAAHCGKPELQSNHLEKSVRGLFVETLETYIWYDFVLNNLESLEFEVSFLLALNY